MTQQTIEVARIRPGRLNIEVTEGDAWTLTLTLARGGSPINLTGATIVARFKPNGSGTETTLTFAATDLAAGTFTIGQAAGATGSYAVVVTEAGATARTMVKGGITAERVL